MKPKIEVGKHIGCKHLDYKGNYFNCELIETSEGYKYWRRDKSKIPEGAPINVQFCKERGRINGIFQCINKGEMRCYEE